ncbi:MAG TPA: helix-hairpin-helix domain-containing protein, partial [Methanocorpusculum sp.]|nr:helix-hairpin-helix domain-containing protein [Methanocorpusculum sp.]
AGRICHEFSPGSDEEMKNLETRVMHGVKEELLPLITLKGIGRVRARRLFDQGITDPKALLTAQEHVVISILGATIAQKVLEQAGKNSAKKKRTESEEGEEELQIEKKPQLTLFDFGEVE